MNFFDWFSASYLYCVSVTCFVPFIFNYHSWDLCNRFFHKKILFYVYIFDLQTVKNDQSCYYIFFPNHRNTENGKIQKCSSWHTTNRTYLKLVNRFTIIRKFSSETQYLDDGCLKQCVEGRGLQLQEL